MTYNSSEGRNFLLFLSIIARASLPLTRASGREWDKTKLGCWGFRIRGWGARCHSRVEQRDFCSAGDPSARPERWFDRTPSSSRVFAANDDISRDVYSQIGNSRSHAEGREDLRTSPGVQGYGANGGFLIYRRSLVGAMAFSSDCKIRILSICSRETTEDGS
jgi:hypothetical protein